MGIFIIVPLKLVCMHTELLGNYIKGKSQLITMSCISVMSHYALIPITFFWEIKLPILRIW